MAGCLVRAEAQLCGNFATQRVPAKLLIALCTQIVTSLLVHVVTDGVGRFVVESFQDFLNLEQVIAIVVRLIHFHRFHRGAGFNLYDVTQVADDAVDALRRAIPGVHIRQY